MSKHAENLPDDPAVLKAMIAALQAENAKMSATLRVHDQLVQTLRLRIAKLQKLAFGKASEKISCLALPFVVRGVRGLMRHLRIRALGANGQVAVAAR
jgi:uncharacterized protein with von Willebrand factor type A (vWA) domain